MVLSTKFSILFYFILFFFLQIDFLCSTKSNFCESIKMELATIDSVILDFNERKRIIKGAIGAIYSTKHTPYTLIENYKYGVFTIWKCGFRLMMVGCTYEFDKYEDTIYKVFVYESGSEYTMDTVDDAVTFIMSQLIGPTAAKRRKSKKETGENHSSPLENDIRSLLSNFTQLHELQKTKRKIKQMIHDW